NRSGEAAPPYGISGNSAIPSACPCPRSSRHHVGRLERAAPAPARSLTLASDRQRAAPGIFALERAIEIEHVNELVSGVGRLTHEQTQINQREYHIADVRAAPDAPMLEHHASHHAEPLQRQVAAGERQLEACDVPAFVEALLAILERRQGKQIGALVEPRLAQPDPIHDPVSKCQFRHPYLVFRRSDRPLDQRPRGRRNERKSRRSQKMKAEPRRHNSPRIHGTDWLTDQRNSETVSRLLISDWWIGSRTLVTAGGPRRIPTLATRVE